MGEAPRRKIVILGGGVASLTAAVHLTDQPGWDRKYDITLYQYGWRLGGKGASGRRRDAHLRNEEHGLHVWFGFYENAFSTLRGVYDELDLPPDYPIRTVDQAFKPHWDNCQIMENVEGDWRVWAVKFPPHSGEPGVNPSEPNPWDAVIVGIDFIIGQVEGWLRKKAKETHPVLAFAEELLEKFPGVKEVEGLLDTSIHRALKLAVELGKEEADPALHDRADHDRVREFLQHFHDWAKDEIEKELGRAVEEALVKDDFLRRLWIVVNLGCSTICGLIEDDVFRKGLASLDDEELRHWLGRHGVTQDNLSSAPVRTFYDTFFAMRTDGDEVVYDYAAGVGLGCGLRSALTYKGAALYEMQAGMGDVVVAPAYRLLKQRGVKFKLFHKVRKLELTPDKAMIGRVRIGVQATVKGGGEYEPLFDAKGLIVWPSEPFYEQLVEGEELQATGINLESHWAPWEDVETLELELGKDFDQVLLGISLGGLGEICGELMDAHDGWKTMIETVPTMQSMSAQLWIDRTPGELGWTWGPEAVTAAPEDLSVWADMSQVIQFEEWPAGDLPKGLRYLCGPMTKDYLAMPPDPSVPQKAYDAVVAETVRWLDTYARFFWPAAVTAGGDFDWNVLHAPAEVVGQARLGQQFQFLRANIDPTERCPVSASGVMDARFAQGETGFFNLVVCGDWTYTAINSCCVEAAVMSGMQASRAICGFPKHVVGEDFLQD
jgi:uncharacterized protein with NAD-binding domain and iron-sulfur cluster